MACKPHLGPSKGLTFSNLVHNNFFCAVAMERIFIEMGLKSVCYAQMHFPSHTSLLLMVA